MKLSFLILCCIASLVGMGQTRDTTVLHKRVFVMDTANASRPVLVLEDSMYVVTVLKRGKKTFDKYLDSDGQPFRKTVLILNGPIKKTKL